jgi:hypothetical protein
MSTRYAVVIIAVTLCWSPLVAATEVATWVDEHGVTHFGNAQFAPPGAATSVAVPPANGMDVVQTRATAADRGRGPAVSVLKRSRMENPRGFRGYEGRRITDRQTRRN